MRQISFSLTIPQILARAKTVTRRVGWETLEVGTLLQGVERGQGLKKGDKVKKLSVVRVIGVRRERLGLMVEDRAYGLTEVALEGFPGRTPESFVEMFSVSHDCTVNDFVTRIEFSYVE